MAEPALKNQDDYMENAEGALIPKSKIKPVDLIRDELVKRIIEDAKDARVVMSEFKATAMSEIEKFVSLSAEEYGAKVGGKKGNITLMSYDGKYKLQRAISEYIVFDERLQVAKELIDECLHEWTEGSRDELKSIIDYSFKTNNEGQVSTGRIIGLKRLDIQDAKWQRAMQAITDAMQVAGTKSYVRLYERDDNGQYQPIALDIAAI
jgi:hypothetical protein